MTIPSRPDRPQSLADERPNEEYSLKHLPVYAPPKPNGPALAAIVAVGVGAFALGLLTVLGEAIPAFRTLLSFYNPVGPLAGKTTYSVIVWLVAWAILEYRWKGHDVDFGRAWLATLILVSLGFLGTFPIFFQLFTVR